jgi:DNA repair exonuclease SbcCD nuclease subunit
VKLLCLHQAVEGATVGPADFVFRTGNDVVRGRDVPSGFAAILSGHIHRSQALVKDLSGRPLAAPVLYAGSTERTSFAERHEPKGFLVLEVAPGGDGGRVTWEFHDLAARPMVDVALDPRVEDLAARLNAALATLDPRSIVRLSLTAEPPAHVLPFLRAESLRATAPRSMSVSVAWRRASGGFARR